MPWKFINLGSGTNVNKCFLDLLVAFFWTYTTFSLFFCTIFINYLVKLCFASEAVSPYSSSGKTVVSPCIRTVYRITSDHRQFLSQTNTQWLTVRSCGFIVKVREEISLCPANYTTSAASVRAGAWQTSVRQTARSDARPRSECDSGGRGVDQRDRGK